MNAPAREAPHILYDSHIVQARVTRDAPIAFVEFVRKFGHLWPGANVHTLKEYFLRVEVANLLRQDGGRL